MGQARSVSTANAADATLFSELGILEVRASLPDNINLTLDGIVGNQQVRYAYDPTAALYMPDVANGAGVTRSALLNSLTGEDRLFFSAVPVGQGSSYSIDRDADGIRNADEPPPTLEAGLEEAELALQWPDTFWDWYLETAPALNGPWQTLQAPRQALNGAFQVRIPLQAAPSGFFRLRRTW
jgi:hypothetical protein